MTDIAFSVDADGVAVITWDQGGRSMNVIDPAATLACADLVERVLADPAIRGAVLTSAKPSFIAGADLAWIESLTVHDPAVPRDDRIADLLKEGRRLQHLTRRIETGGKPFAAAVNGTALGGGFELCLACHHRVVADRSEIQLGLPEVKVGLLPAAGGTMRLLRMMGAIAALPLLLDGHSLSPAEALKVGLVDALVPQNELMAAAKSWVLSAGPGDVTKPWDRPGFVPPGPDPRSGPGGPAWSLANARLRRRGYGNYPALEAIQYAVYDGWLVPMDTALKIELRAFVKLLLGSNARNMIRTHFINRQRANKMPARPAEVARTHVRRLGIVGTVPVADALIGLAAAVGIDAVQVAVSGSALGLLLQPDDLRAMLADCDFVLMAGYTMSPAWTGLLRQIEDGIRPTAVIAVDTAAVAEVGTGCRDPSRIVGLHLCRPVDRMWVAEIVAGPQTEREPLARAFDLARALGRTPIMVTDGAALYTDTLLSAYAAEGRAMVREGHAPTLIENAGRALGMAMPPLAVSDEMSLSADECGSERRLVAETVIRHGRSNGRSGLGFNERLRTGDTRFWPGLSDLAPPRTDEPSFDDVKLRLITIQVLEAARCLAEGVVGSPADADIAAVFGAGFAPWTGGPISYIETTGMETFVATCHRLTERLGPRFDPSIILRSGIDRSGADNDAPVRVTKSLK
ncbi:enoyl-CoA hydratase-related protein [Methylobacterium fujisawaense]|uniref:enoyl-CoA hydratase-related protein n=1 Tax=Methylobacterium fujisawaense TaxID=107400 RepID=UPI002F358A51